MNTNRRRIAALAIAGASITGLGLATGPQQAHAATPAATSLWINTAPTGLNAADHLYVTMNTATITTPMVGSTMTVQTQPGTGITPDASTINLHYQTSTGSWVKPQATKTTTNNTVTFTVPITQQMVGAQLQTYGYYQVTDNTQQTFTAQQTSTIAGTTATATFTTANPKATTVTLSAAAAAMNIPFYQADKPTGGTFFTTSQTDAKNAATYGYSTYDGNMFNASPKAADGLVAIHKLFKASTGDYLYVPDGSSELTSAVNTYGYTNQSVPFYASTTQQSGTIPVTRLQKGGAHLYVTTDKQVNGLIAAGWTNEGVRFYVSPNTVTAPVTTTPTMPAEPATGSLPIGQAVYTAPTNALWVSTTGSDTATGTQAAPFKTIAHALAAATTGQTIVVRAGTYHESLTNNTAGVTIQNAPGEAVWLDGSEQYSNWTANGSTWTAPYTYSFDSGPTFTKGKADSTQTNWNFVNANEPMAAHPDQVWIDGTRQTQVASADKVTAGTFYVDTTNQKLILGTNPAGHDVQVATLQQALKENADNQTLRGIGVRNYANTQYMMGEVVSYSNNATFENDEIDNAATGGLGIYRANNKVSHVTVDSAGMSDMLGNNADGLVVDHTKLTNSNTEKFNFAPAAAGIKVSRTNGVTLSNSQISDNYSTGFWTDEDTRDINVVNDTFARNARNGLMLELSARATVANNHFTDNGESGTESIFISDTNKTTVFANSVEGPRAAIRLGQDSRTRANQPGVGDSRTGAIDSDMTWQTQNTVIENNILQNDGAANTTLPEGRGNLSNYGIIHAQNYSGATNNQMVSTEDGNELARTSTSPQFTVVWQPAGASFKGYSTLDAFRAAVSGMDTHSSYTAGTLFGTDGTTKAAGAAAASGSSNTATGVAMPATIASLTGRSTGDTTIGAN